MICKLILRAEYELPQTSSNRIMERKAKLLYIEVPLSIALGTWVQWPQTIWAPWKLIFTFYNILRAYNHRDGTYL